MMVSRSFKIAGIVISIPILLMASCSYLLFSPKYEKSGSFLYKCRGGGVFDGSTCYAKIEGNYYLRLMEDSHDRPHITFLVNGGGERVIPPGPGNNQRYIVAVGSNDVWLIAKDDLGNYYVVERALKYPVVKPALSQEEYIKFFEDRPRPELRPTLDPFK